MKNTQTRRFSKEQRQAISIFDRDICVAAAAGSGKTTLLVERFLYGVTKKGMDAERILAITFTDKAANQMKARLVAECSRRGLYEERRKLENAALSTIHSFCAKVLRENPIESGIDPRFLILAEGEAEILMNQTLDGIFEQESRSDLWIQVLVENGEAKIRDKLKRCYDLYRAFGGEDRVFRIEDVSGAREEIRTGIVGLLRRLEDSIRQTAGTKAERKLGEAASDQLAFWSQAPAASWRTLGRLAQFEGQLHLRCKRFKEDIRRVRHEIGDWTASLAQDLGEPAKKEFVRVLHRFREAYENQKKLRASYDFEDLLLLVYRLFLSDSHAARKVLKRYRDYFSCVLVDEVQDISALQEKIIRLISRPGRLFVVGDFRQSIYGFRHADPQILAGFEKAFSKNALKISLTENYRSRPEILRFVNGVSGKIFGDSYKALRGMRAFSEKQVPSVEFLPVERQDGQGLEQACLIEAGTVAERIRDIVGQRLSVEVPGGSRRPIGYGDIAILFKASTHFRLYEKELSALGIPYTSAKGAGFFEKTEIMDLVNFLKLIEDPNQDVPLAGVLRSPFVMLSDDALFWLAGFAKKNGREEPLGSALRSAEAAENLAPEDRRRLSAFVGLLEDLANNKSRLKLSELLRRILKATHYQAKALTQPDGIQKIANIFKLIETAESLESKGFCGVEDFVGFLKNLSDREIEEPEASVGIQALESVTLSTIHAAKGLEFPCVILADMGSGRKKDRLGNFLADPESGLGMRSQNPLTRKPVEDLTYSRIRKRVDQRDLEESDRLLYVALTRAKEHLVLSGVLDMKPDPDEGKDGLCWMRRIADIIGFRPGRRRLDFEKVIIRVLNPEAGTGKERPASRRLADMLPLREALDAQQALAAKPGGGFRWVVDDGFLPELRERLRPLLRPYQETEDRTVTGVVALSAEKSQTGPSLQAPGTGTDNENESAVPRNEYGTVFHRFMEALISGRDSRFLKSPQALYLCRGLSDPEKREVFESAERFWKGSLGRQIRQAGRCYTELPFIYKTPYGILKGQMDLVFRTREGRWTLVDYKTDRIREEEKEERARLHQFQLGIYALVFRKLYGEAPQCGVVYFSAIHRAVERVYEDRDLAGYEESLHRCLRSEVVQDVPLGQGFND